jgi:hypothetical protein
MNRQQFSIDQIFKSIGPSIVWVDKLDRTGSRFDRAMGFVIGPRAIATAFQAIDSATTLEVEFADGRKIRTNKLFAFSRTGDWAIIEADTGSTASVPRSDVSELLIGQKLALFTFDSNTRVLGVVDVGGQGVMPGFGGRIQITPEAAPEVAGGPLIDAAGRAVGNAGGSLRPGARLSRPVLTGNRDIRETLAHGTGGSAISSGTIISDLPRELPSNTRTLDELAAEGSLSPMLFPMPELITAGTSNDLRKRISAGLPPEVSEFSRRAPEVGIFTVWTKKGKLSKGSISIQAFDTGNKLRVTSPAKRISLSREAQEVGFTFSPSSLEPGTYRVDLSWDGVSIWRTFVRIIE